MARQLSIIVIFSLLLMITTSCVSSYEGDQDLTEQNQIKTSQVTPTYDCTVMYDSGIYPSTPTPTYLDYVNSSGDTKVSISRVITYESIREECLNLPNSDITLTITRNGINHEVSMINVLQGHFDDESVGGSYIREIEFVDFQDLDRDGIEELIVYFHLRGASCCTGLVIFYFEEKDSEYYWTNIIMRKYTHTPRLEDNDGDSIPEFVTLDQFSPALIRYSNSRAAITTLEIFIYSENKLIEVTSLFPIRVKEHALHWLNRYLTESSDDDPDCIEYLGVYLAEMHFVGEGPEGNRVFDESCTALFDPHKCDEYKNLVLGRLSERGN